MKRLLLGGLGGALLSASRLPAGLDLIGLTGVSPLAQGISDALAFGLIALAIGLARSLFDGRTGLDLLVAGGLGFAAHAGWLQRRAEPFGWLALAVPALALSACALWIARSARPLRAEAGPSERGAPLLARLGFALVGLGAALSLSILGRHLRWLGAGSDRDEALFGSAFALLAVLGALSFGPYLRKSKVDAAGARAFALGAMLSAAAGIGSLKVLSGLRSPRGLDRFLRSWGLDTSLIGTWSADLALAAPVLVLPAFLFGTAIYCARRAGELAALFGGAMLLPLAVGWRLNVPAGTLEVESLPFSAELIVDGCLLACAGALIASASLRGTPRARVGGVLLSLALALGAWLLPALRMPIYSPWSQVPPIPALAFECPAGLATVEGAELGDVRATLNRRQLTPPAAQAALDAQRIELSLRLLETGSRGRAARVLFVGQLTPARAAALTSGAIREVERVDRTASWYSLCALFEQELFRSERELARIAPAAASLLPPGECLSPGMARERIEAGAYDLVLVAPIGAQSPILPADIDRLGEHAVVVAWFDGAEEISRLTFDRALALAGGWTELSVALISGPQGSGLPRAGDHLARVTPGEVLLVDAHANQDALPLAAWLGSTLPRRKERSRADLAASLARANAGGPADALCRGLARHFAAQRPSSPYQSSAERVELDAQALELLQTHALGHEPDAFTRELWSQLAGLMMEKREIASIYRFLPALIERWGSAPWPRLQRALAQADLEALQPDSAARRLESLIELFPEQAELYEEAGRAQLAAGRAVEAVASLRRCLELAPEREDELARDLTIALLRAGESEGLIRAQILLEQEPEDAQLRALLEAGPQPIPSPIFDPSSAHDH